MYRDPLAGHIRDKRCTPRTSLMKGNGVASRPISDTHHSVCFIVARVKHLNYFLLYLSLFVRLCK